MKDIFSRARAVMLVVLLAMIAGIGNQTASAATAVVGNCESGVTFSTIQAAVNAVPAGSSVDVCPGTYREQILINKNLTLHGASTSNSNAVVILPPVGGLLVNATRINGTAVAAQIYVTGPPSLLTAPNHVTVDISNIIVDGTGNGIAGCSPDFIGVYYADASGTLAHVTTKNQTLGSGLGGCQTGLGIFVESNSAVPGKSYLIVKNSTVQDFQKNGITAQRPGTIVLLTNDAVTGAGPTDQIAQNGIEVAFGAIGTVTTNTVLDYIYTGAAPATSTGILLFNAGTGVSITSNVVGDTQGGIVLASDSADYPGYPTDDSETVSSNSIYSSLGSFGDGIDVCSNNNTITSNKIINSQDSAIHFDSGCTSTDGTTGNGNSATQNTVIDACAGILLGSGSGNTSTPNNYFNTANFTLAGDSCSVTPAAPNLVTAEARIAVSSGTKYSPTMP